MDGVERVRRIPACAQRKAMRHELRFLGRVRRPRTRLVGFGIRPLFRRRGGECEARAMVADVNEIYSARAGIGRRENPL